MADWIDGGDCGRVTAALAELGTKDAATALWSVQRCWDLDYASHGEVIANARRALAGGEPSEPVSVLAATAA